MLSNTVFARFQLSSHKSTTSAFFPPQIQEAYAHTREIFARLQVITSQFLLLVTIPASEGKTIRSNTRRSRNKFSKFGKYV